MNEIKKHTDAIARFNSSELDLGTCRKLEIINQEADRLEKEIISLKTDIKRKDEALLFVRQYHMTRQEPHDSIKNVIDSSLSDYAKERAKESDVIAREMQAEVK